MSPHHYILEPNGMIKPVDLMTWAKWFNDYEARVVAQTEIGDKTVSTVFIGLHDTLFETMVFETGNKTFGDYQERAASLEQARQMHADAVKNFTPKDATPVEKMVFRIEDL